MPKKPRFNYFLYTSDNVVLRDSTKWNTPLPLGREMLGEESNQEPESPITIGDYFNSARNFLTNQGADSILDHASSLLGLDVSKNEIDAFNVTLEKHGEFYHPAKIETEICGKNYSFVLNMAVSKPGNDLAEKEFHFLQKLNKKNGPSFLPEGFCLGEIQTKQGKKIRMFLGEWLESFHEFHISYDHETRKNRIKVWIPERNVFISDEKTANLYRQAGKILTFYYAVDTFEQILSWHHAAGDFVVHITGNDVRLKLITVRRYASMFYISGKEADSGNILEAMLFFLLNMSIRMRLDRLDGVGDIVWSDDIAVENCILGFYQGLKLKQNEGLESDFADAYFKSYLSRLNRSILYDLCTSLIGRYYQNNIEVDIIQKNLKEHIHNLHSSLQSFIKSQS